MEKELDPKRMKRKLNDASRKSMKVKS